MLELAYKTLTFSLNPFATQLQNFKVINSTSTKLLKLKQDQPSKKNLIFWLNPYQVITSLIEMLELSNFGDMTKSTIII